MSPRALPLVLLAACTGAPSGDDRGPEDTGAAPVTCPTLALGAPALAWTDLAPGVATAQTLTVSATCPDGPALTLSAAVEGAAFRVSPALASALPGGAVTFTLTATLADPAAEGLLTLVTSAIDAPLVTVPLSATVLYDQDGDGVDADEDCDDADATVYPGAPDAPYDGVDADCAGDDDFDADGDGAGLDDCDDTDSDVFPGAPDTPYDGVDSDCAGDDDDDDDRDGVPLPADCDDADPAVYPGAPDASYDGVDADCAGDDDFDADRDGASLDDCDDTDPAVFPGAPDAPYDGVDADCAGDDDFDADLDGAGLDDCDDADPAVFPGAPDTPYDGVDADCDGASDYDADGDGQDAYPYGGTDCDDADPGTASGPLEADNGVDDDCDGFVDEGYTGPLIVTEVMFAPAAVSDAVGEWFEVFNAGATALDLAGWEVYGDSGTFTVTASLPLAPGAYAVFAPEADPALNGGHAVDWAYTGLTLGDTDHLVFIEGGTSVAELVWDTTWPGARGAAMSLDSGRTEAPTDPASWCAATAPYGDGDVGTPGEGAVCGEGDSGGG